MKIDFKVDVDIFRGPLYTGFSWLFAQFFKKAPITELNWLRDSFCERLITSLRLERLGISYYQFACMIVYARVPITHCKFDSFDS